MDYEDVKEWYTKQYKDPKHQRLLQFDVDCVDWLMAEVERLKDELNQLQSHHNEYCTCMAIF